MQALYLGNLEKYEDAERYYKTGLETRNRLKTCKGILEYQGELIS